MSENKTSKSYRRPIIVAAATLVLGGLASLAFNLKAISLDHAEVLAKAGTPDRSAYVAGILAPMFLAAAIELLQNTPWRTSIGNWAKNPDTWVRGAVLTLVAGVAAWISYWHGVHVLDSWGYDEVAKRVGPIVPDAAMVLATLALHRVAEAKRLAKAGAATLATVATPAPLANPLANVAMAIQENVATLANNLMDPKGSVAAHGAEVARLEAEVAKGQEAPLDEDWGTLEDDLDRELAEMTAAGKAEPEPTTEAAPEAAEEGQEEAPAVRLTTVPELAAKRIRAALEAGASAADLTALDAALAAEGLAGSARTARRWRAAVANRTARVS